MQVQNEGNIEHKTWHNLRCSGVFHHFAIAKCIETFISLWPMLKEVVRKYSLVSGVPCMAEIHHKLLCLADSAEVFLAHNTNCPTSSCTLNHLHCWCWQQWTWSSQDIWRGSVTGAPRQFTKLLRWIINIVFPLPPIGKIIRDPGKLSPRMHQSCEVIGWWWSH